MNRQSAKKLFWQAYRQRAWIGNFNSIAEDVNLNRSRRNSVRQRTANKILLDGVLTFLVPIMVQAGKRIKKIIAIYAISKVMVPMLSAVIICCLLWLFGELFLPDGTHI